MLSRQDRNSEIEYRATNFWMVDELIAGVVAGGIEQPREISQYRAFELSLGTDRVLKRLLAFFRFVVAV